MKIIAGLVIKKRLIYMDEINKCYEHILTFISNVDHLYIYNMSGSSLNGLYEKLARHSNVEYVDCPLLGEAIYYNIIMEKAIEEEADFSVVLETGYYYEEGAFLALKRYLIEHDYSNISVLSPMPLFSCIMHERGEEEVREIKGCRMTGALINVHIYKTSNHFNEAYYQNTFDYDYELTMRQLGKRVLLLSNEVLRNTNYLVMEKRILFIKTSTYDRDLIDLYYETRNRRYLWDKFKTIEPQYVKKDKKLARLEKREMRSRDTSYQEKKEMIEQAIADYKAGITGKYL